MYVNLRKSLIIITLLLVASCVRHQETYYIEDTEEVEVYIECTEDGSVCRTIEKDSSQKFIQPKNESIARPGSLTVSGNRICPVSGCPEEQLLPPEPCIQPIPTYYGNMSEIEKAEGIVLIHPITRTKIVCFDIANKDAISCAKHFQSTGYVLITDLPQFSGNYDTIRTNSYPTRRWRDGGEIYPRW